MNRRAGPPTRQPVVAAGAVPLCDALPGLHRRESPRTPLLRPVRRAASDGLPSLRRAEPARRAVLRRLRGRPRGTTGGAGGRGTGHRAAAGLDPLRRPGRVHAARRGARPRGRLRELLSRYFELAATVVGRHGGTVEKFIGDAVVAVWGTPVAQEDDAERAVRTALELVAASPSWSRGWPCAPRSRPARRR